jgi:hypothetical protein
MATGTTSIQVDVLNHDETPTGQTVLVELSYEERSISGYGADADGNRGTTIVERHIIDHYIDPAAVRALDSWQVERLLEDAAEAFYNRA